MNPELRKRFIDSIDYLRKMDFFKNYSKLSLEEISEQIFDGEMIIQMTGLMRSMEVNLVGGFV
ncbi:MAG: hypothetical protein QXO76_10970 [Thermoproteota archaeon]